MNFSVLWPRKPLPLPQREVAISLPWTLSPGQENPDTSCGRLAGAKIVVPSLSHQAPTTRHSKAPVLLTLHDRLEAPTSQGFPADPKTIIQLLDTPRENSLPRWASGWTLLAHCRCGRHFRLQKSCNLYILPTRSPRAPELREPKQEGQKSCAPTDSSLGRCSRRN
jgi:hypothetical protein